MIKYRLSILGITIVLLTFLFTGCSDRNLPFENVQGPSGPQLGIVLPPGASLQSATFHAYVYRIDDLNSVPVDIHRVTADWNEMTVTNSNFHANGNQNYNPAASAAFDGVLVNTPDTWVSVDVTDLVQGWVAGEYYNYGFLMRKPQNSPRTVFYSREGDAVPYLEMIFDTPDGELVITEDALADAMIAEDTAEEAWGYTDKLYTGNKNGFEKQSLIRFDLPEFSQDRIEEGCTHRLRWWKSHSGRGCRPDEISSLLPIWLGDEGGDKSRSVETNGQAFAYLAKNVFGRPRNGITRLYAQLLTAKLNIATGADSADIDATIAEVDEYLTQRDWRHWNCISQAEKTQVQEWRRALIDYNRGVTGPGMCD